ncbi:L-threonylcarbamoyladenylate synthase [Sphingomonas sp. RB3P16]|uniref:L-threonylcarbamoyladenylate synthase n=1 Tax=Parasphingomonas frigoris TaxID=3096163 RepID=UPI002FC8E5CF
MIPPNPPFTTQTLPYGEAAIAAAAALILTGQPVAIASETVYGLAADATDSAAVARIYQAKGRPSFNPLIVHVLDLAAAEAIAEFDPVARALAEAFWPGPLTLVLPLRVGAGIAAAVTAGLPTIALRVPAHRAMRALIAASGKPLAAPSANASGAISPTQAAHVVASLDGRIALVVDDGATESGLESTIVATAGGLRVLRPGPITAEALARFGTLSPVTEKADSLAAPAITAPGQLESHYAPSKPLRLNATTAAPDEYLIGFGTIAGTATLSPTADLVDAATNLFAALHAADASPSARIAIAPIPSEGIGAAINDRLKRAAHRDA